MNDYGPFANFVPAVSNTTQDTDAQYGPFTSLVPKQASTLSIPQRLAVASEPWLSPTLNAVASAGEPLASLMTGMVAMPVAGIAGLGAGLIGGNADYMADTVRNVSDALTYHPTTPSGKQATEILMTPLNLLQQGAQYAGGKVLQGTGSPTAATTVDTAIQAAGVPLGLKAAGALTGLIGSGAAALLARAKAAREAPLGPDPSVADQMRAVKGEAKPIAPTPTQPTAPVVSSWEEAKTVTPEPQPMAGVRPTPEAPPDEAAIPAPPGAPLFKPKPGDEPDVPRHAVVGNPIEEIPVASLKLSDDVPQFKKGANKEGVVEPLGGKFDRQGLAPIQVWERTNGDQEVISGRHRLHLAKRSGEDTIPAQVYKESEGFTQQQAATLDAQLNIRDEHGSIGDYANYFKGSDLTEEEANARGLLDRAKGRSGYAIARDAGVEVFAAHSAGILSDEAAERIALAAPKNDAIQAVGQKLVQEGKSISVAENTMRAVAMMERNGEAKPDQGDMFGFDDSAIKEATAMARKASSAQREISEQLAAVSGATKRPEIAKRLGVDVKNPEAVLAKIEELKAERQRLENWPLYPDLVRKFRGEPEAKPAEPLELQGESEAEIKARESAQAKADEEARKRESAPPPEDFVMSGSNRPADEAEARGQKSIFDQPKKEASTPDQEREDLDTIINLNLGITPQDIAKGIGELANAAQEAVSTMRQIPVVNSALDWVDTITKDIQMKVAPMAVGSDRSMAAVKDWANADRKARYHASRWDDILKKNFTPEQQEKMWDAADDEDRIRREELPESERADRGLNRLTKEELEVVEYLNQEGQKAYDAATAAGMNKGFTGVKYWSPRMVAMIGEDGTISMPNGQEGILGSPFTSPTGLNITKTAGSLKHRKYGNVEETEAAAKAKFGEGATVVRNVRAYPIAIARMQRAVAGKILIDNIEKMGKDTGQDVVTDQPKEGFFTIPNHPAFLKYRYRPDVVHSEAFDEHMMGQLNKFAEDIGITPETRIKMGGRLWEKASPSGEVVRKLGGPETVLTHELGHQLDFKYGLINKMFGGKRPLSDFILERMKGKAEREGNTAKVERLEKQIIINKEMRALADLRFEGVESSDGFKKYVRESTEKMANMVHAYVHMPERFKQVAPESYQRFKGFLNAHPELHRLDEIKPSLVLGTKNMTARPPGEDYDVFPVYVSNEFKGPLKAIMSDQPSDFTKFLMTIKGKTMTTIMYSPLIHNGVEYGRAMPLMPGKIITFKVYFDGNVAKHNPEIMNLALDNGLVPIGHRFGFQDITGVLEETELKPGRSWTAQILGGGVGLVNKAAGESVKHGIDVAGDFWHNTLLWDRVADLQMGLYVNMEKGLIKDGMDTQTAGRLAAHFANRYAGSIPKESMSNGFRTFANFAFFSRTFTFGNLGVMKDMMTGLPKDVQAQIIRDAGVVANFAAKGKAQAVAIHAFGNDIALMFLANSALQSSLDNMKRDKSISDIEQGYVDRFNRLAKKIKESPTDLFLPISDLQALTPMSENEPGKEYRVLYGYDDTGTAIYMRLPTGKIGEEFIGWLTSPIDTLARKEGTLARPIIQTANNDKGFGRRVWNPNEKGFTGAAKAMGNIAWNFLSQQFPTESFNSAIDMARGKADDTEALKVIGPLFGVTFSKGAPGGPEVGIMFTEEREHRADVADIMPDVKKLIRKGDLESATSQMQQAHMTPREIAYTIYFTNNPKARITPKAMKLFMQTAQPEDLERMQRARDNAPEIGVNHVP